MNLLELMNRKYIKYERKLEKGESRFICYFVISENEKFIYFNFGFLIKVEIFSIDFLFLPKNSSFYKKKLNFYLNCNSSLKNGNFLLKI